MSGAHSLHPHVIQGVTCLSVRWLFSCFVFFFLSLSLAPLLSLHCLLVLCPAHQLLQCRNRRGLNPVRIRTMRTIAPHRHTTLSQVYEPNQLDNSDYSEASAVIFQDESSDIDAEPYSCDAEFDDETVGTAPSSPLFIQEREEPANRRQILSLSSRKFVASSVFFRTHKCRETHIVCRVSVSDAQHMRTSQNENHVATQKMSKTGFFWNDKKSKFLLQSDLRPRSTSSRV